MSQRQGLIALLLMLALSAYAAGCTRSTPAAPPRDVLVARFNDFQKKHAFLVVHDRQRWITLLAGNEHLGWWAAPAQSQVAITVGLDPFIAAGLNPDLLAPDLWQPHSQPGSGPHAHHATSGLVYVRTEHLDVSLADAVTDPGKALDALLQQLPELAGSGPVSGAPALLFAGGDGVEWQDGELAFFLNAEAIAAAGADVTRVDGWELVKGKPRLLVRRVQLPG